MTYVTLSSHYPLAYLFWWLCTEGKYVHMYVCTARVLWPVLTSRVGASYVRIRHAVTTCGFAYLAVPLRRWRTHVMLTVPTWLLGIKFLSIYNSCDVFEVNDEMWYWIVWEHNLLNPPFSLLCSYYMFYITTIMHNDMLNSLSELTCIIPLKLELHNIFTIFINVNYL